MSKYNKFRLSSTVKILFRMWKYDIWPQSECQNRILNVELRYSLSVRMSKNEKRKKRKPNTWYSASFRMSKQVSECQKTIFGLNANVKIGFWMLNIDGPPQFECRTRAGFFCKTLCPQLPDFNTAWLQHCLPMAITTVQIYEISMLFYQKGNNSKN